MSKHNIEESMMKGLSQMADKDPIPESLTPEAMRARLESVTPAKSKKNRHIGRIVAAAACFVVLIGAGIAWNQTRSTAPSSGGGTKATVANKPKQLVAAGDLQTASNYKEIQNAVKSARFTDAFGNFVEDIFSDGSMTKNDVVEEATGSDTNASIDATTENTEHSETNTQEEGVDEADVVKTDGNYLYVLKHNDMRLSSRYDSIEVYKLEQGKLIQASSIDITSNEYTTNDFYLTNQKLVLVNNINSYQQDSQTSIIIYDVKDPSNPKKISENKQEGSLSTTRIVDGYLYTISSIYKATKDFSTGKKGIPKLNEKTMSANDVYLPYDIANTEYLLVSSLNLENPKKFQDQKAFLTGSSNFYVSDKCIYVSSPVFTSVKKDGVVYNTEQTEIIRLPYEKGEFKKAKHGIVPGVTNDNFSYNEKDGYLRVVTTVSTNTYTPRGRHQVFELPDTDRIAVVPNSLGEQYNGLYILDQDMKMTGNVTGLAPGESIYSSRFLGDYGYFVTYRQMDPLFSVDLSDPKNPKVLDALKIPGFSTYLHFFSETQLFGFGDEILPDTQSRLGLKLSLFDVSNPVDIRESDKCVLTEFGADASSEASSNYKAFLYDGNRKLFGFSVNYYDWQDSNAQTLHYVLYSYDANGFTKSLDIPLDDIGQSNIYYSGIRGVIAGDYLYVSSSIGGVSSYSLADGTKIDQVLYR